MKTDAQLQLDVMAELQWDSTVRASGISVEVKDGVATLAGEVSSYGEKWNAARAARRVKGVKALTVKMNVKLSEFDRRLDADIAQAATSILHWTSPLHAQTVKVTVEDGWLTLSGEVEWQHLRQNAANSVRYLQGIKGVSNKIAVKPRLSTSVVKSDIEAALGRHVAVDAAMISVYVNGAEVTLSGTVHSWAERDLVRRAAWGAAGVGDVFDKMTLVY